MTKETPTQRRILDIIQASAVALSHAEIKSALGDADRVTVYRTIKRLLEEKQIYKIITLDGVIRYAIYSEQKKQQQGRIHFSCIKCKTITCLDEMPAFTLPNQYTVMEMNFVLSGLCPACSYKPSCVDNE